MNRQLHGLLLPVLVAWVFGQGLAAASEKTVFIQGDEVYVSVDGAQPTQLTDSGIPKGRIRWSPDGTRLAYTEATDRSIATTRVMVIDLSGSVVMNKLIQEGASGEVAAFRGVEDFRWFGEDSLGLYGSYNPRNCELIVLRPSTGTVLQDVGLGCGHYRVSSDGQHVVHHDFYEMGVATNERRDWIMIDGELVFPKGVDESVQMQVTAEPQWAPDGRSVALVTKNMKTGDMSVVVVDQTKVIVQEAISPSFVDDARLAWSGRSVIIAGKNLTINFDPSTRQWREASPEEAVAVSRREALEKARIDREREARARETERLARGRYLDRCGICQPLGWSLEGTVSF